MFLSWGAIVQPRQWYLGDLIRYPPEIHKNIIFQERRGGDIRIELNEADFSYSLYGDFLPNILFIYGMYAFLFP